TLERLVPEDEAKTLLEPFLEPFGHSIQEGSHEWDIMRQLAPGQVVHLPKVRRAGIMNDLVVARAKAHFEFLQGPGVRPFDDHGFYAIAIQGRVLVRFKKHDEDLLTSTPR